MSELEVWNELGNIYYNTGAYDESIRAYSKAIELDQGCERSYTNLASIYVNQERYEEAISLLQSGVEHLEAAADKALLWERLGDVYRKLEDFDNSLAAYQNAVELDPDNSTFQGKLAEAKPDSACNAGENEVEGVEAIDEIEVQEASPSPGLPLEEAPSPEPSGETCKAEENMPEAAPVMLGGSLLSDAPIEAETTDVPEEGDSISSEVEDPGIALAGTEQDNEVTEMVQETVKDVEDISSPETRLEGGEVDANEVLPNSQQDTEGETKVHAEAFLQLGILHWRKMDYEKASQFLHTACRIAAKFGDNRFESLCLNTLACVETDLGRYDDAIQAYEKAASLDPEYILPWNKLGALYSQLGQYEKAMATFQKAIEYSPKDGVSWNGLGDVYHKLGRNEDAIAAYQLGNVFDKQAHTGDTAPLPPMTFESDRKDPQMWAEMGNISYESGAYEDAVDAYAKAIEFQDGVADKALLWNRLGEVYQQLGDQNNALAAHQKAIELDQTNAELQEGSAQAESVSEQVISEIEVESPESAIEVDQGNSALAEPDVTEPNSSEPEGPGLVEAEQDSFAEAEHAEENAAGPDAPGASSDVTGEPEPEAAYWVFRPKKPFRRSPRPAVQPCVAMASAVQPSPAVVMPRLIDQAFLGDQLLLEDSKDADVVVVEPEPKADAATASEHDNSPIEQVDHESAAPEMETRSSEISDTKPIKLDALGLQTARAGNRFVNQLEKNLHSLENDIAAYRRVTEINPKNDRAWDALGNMYEAAGLHSEAIAAFEQAISLDAKKEVYYYHLGLAYAAQANYEEAIQALKEVVDLNPGYMLAHCALAGYYRRVDNEVEAQKHIAIARPTMENENEYNRACFESICGNTDKAIEFLKAALDKQQIQLDWVRNDPDLDFIRSDSRFDALLRESGAHE